MLEIVTSFKGLNRLSAIIVLEVFNIYSERLLKRNPGGGKFNKDKYIENVLTQNVSNKTNLIHMKIKNDVKIC